MTASPALLTKEFESAMEALRDASDPHGTSHAVLLPAEATALLQRIAALEQRVEAAEAALRTIADHSNDSMALQAAGKYFRTKEPR